MYIIDNLAYKIIMQMNRSLYANNIATLRVNDNYDSLLISNGGGFNIDQRNKSAIGEYLERESVMKEVNPNHKIDGVSLRTGKIKKIKNEQIFFLAQKNNDTCGLASGPNSSFAIRAALLEYYERQSLLFGWINGQRGYEININNLKEVGKKEVNLLNKYSDKIWTFEISIFWGISVIFMIAYNSYDKYIGLGSGFTTAEAINNALSEILETFGDKRIKDFNINDRLANRVPIKEIRKINPLAALFYSLSNDEFFSEFRYLKYGHDWAKLMYIDKERKITEVLSENFKRLKHEPYVVFVPPLHNTNRIKIAKIIGNFGYPNLFVNEFSEREINNYSMLLPSDKEIKKRIQPIPFL